MTEERDPEVSAAYRELGAEEPPRALDDAILAAARRAGRQRWYAPLATAAVLVLAVAVTWNMQREQPGIESPAQQAAAPPPVADRAVAKTAEIQVEKETAAPAAAEDAKIARRKAEAQPAPPAAATPAVRAPAVALEPKPFKTDQPSTAASGRSDELRGAASGVTGSLSQPIEERANRDVPAAAPARMQAQKLAETPERELERIAEFRTQGRHDEADKALAEFRKRYPEYRIPEAMRERVERR